MSQWSIAFKIEPSGACSWTRAPSFGTRISNRSTRIPSSGTMCHRESFWPVPMFSPWWTNRSISVHLTEHNPSPSNKFPTKVQRLSVKVVYGWTVRLSESMRLLPTTWSYWNPYPSLFNCRITWAPINMISPWSLSALFWACRWPRRPTISREMLMDTDEEISICLPCPKK